MLGKQAARVLIATAKLGLLGVAPLVESLEFLLQEKNFAPSMQTLRPETMALDYIED